jgi:hypothetical protein
LETTCAGGAYAAGAGVIGAGSVTTNVIGSAALTGGFGSGNSSFSNHVINIRMSIIAVKRRIRAPHAMAVGLYHIGATAGQR